MAYVIVLKVPFVKKCQQFKWKKIVTAFENIDELDNELHIKMVN